MKSLQFGSFHAVLLLITSFVFQACGGGGLPGGNSLGLSISATTMNMTAQQTDSTPTSPVITLTASGGAVYIDSDSTINGIYGHGVYCMNTNSCTLEVQPRPPSSLNVGTHTDTINIRGCSDNACNSVFVNHTVTVTYVITEGGAFAVTPTSMSFNSVENTAAAAQTVNVSYSGGIATSWTATVDYANGSNWLTLNPANGSTASPTDISVTAQALTTGTYNATINIVSNGGSVATSIPVTYTVVDARTSPGQLDYTVDLNTQAADLQQTLTVLSNFAEGNVSADWSISSDVNWLLFSQSSGDTQTQNQVTVSVDTNEISNLRNGTHTATITLSSTTPGVSDWTVPVNLVVNLPQVNYVAPYAVFPNTSGEVIIRGSGFAALTSENITFGASSATLVNVISDTEIQVGHAALTAGVYPVAIDNSLGIAMSRADLHVIASASYAADAISTTSSTKYRLVYDAQRQTLYAATISALQRFRYRSGSWVADSIAITNLNDIALSPDGKELIALGSPTAALGSSQIYHIDLDSFAIVDQASFNFRDYNSSNSTKIGQYVLSLAITNDGYAIIGSANLWNGYLKYNLLNNNLEFLDITGMGGGSLDDPALAGTKDGSNLYLAGGFSPVAQFVYTYESAGNGTLQRTSVVDATRYVCTDNTGSRVLLDRNNVYDGQMNYQGQFSFANATTLSADGNTGYAFSAGFSSTPASIQRYDLTSPNGTGGFNSAGSDITMTTDPASNATQMILTPSDQNAFVGGNTIIAVVPIP